MKSLPCLVLLSLAAGATAQNPAQNASEQRIQTVYEKLRANDGLYFAVTGTDRIGNEVTPIGANLFYRTQVINGRLNIDANLVEYVSRRGVPTSTMELIGDGKTLWAHDRLLKTYSATPYDTLNPADPSAQSPTYARDLLFGLNQAASGSGRSSYAARLLRELFADPTGAQYRTWMPGRAPYEAPTYHDPFNNYDVTQPNCTYVVYPDDGRRSIAFEIYTDPNTGVDALQRIYITELSRYGGKRRVVSYSIAPLVIQDFSSARFTPYNHSEIQGWRPTVAPKPVRG